MVCAEFVSKTKSQQYLKNKYSLVLSMLLAFIRECIFTTSSPYFKAFAPNLATGAGAQKR